MDLKASSVHRNLDTKLKIVGMEAHDLLFVLLFASIMNLIFGKTTLGLYFVIVIPGIIAIVLFITKRNKPDGYLPHLVKFALTPGVYLAGELGSKETQRRKKVNDTKAV